jgi:hypothetical protein
MLADCEPIYEDHPGWKDSTVGVKTFEHLPANAQTYLKRMEELCGVPADIISTGPDGAAPTLRANSDLKSSEYCTPVLGLIFLKFADNNYRRHEPAILAEYSKRRAPAAKTRCPKSPSSNAASTCPTMHVTTTC